MGLLDNDKARVDDVDPNAPPTDLPATFMGPLDADLLRRYQAWLEREMLSAQLECISCGEVCQSFVTQGDIGIFCKCRVLVSKVS